MHEICTSVDNITSMSHSVLPGKATALAGWKPSPKKQGQRNKEAGVGDGTDGGEFKQKQEGHHWKNVALFKSKYKPSKRQCSLTKIERKQSNRKEKNFNTPPYFTLGRIKCPFEMRRRRRKETKEEGNKK